MHPFDNESISEGSSESWFSHVQESRGRWPSQNYFRVEARLKERIVHGKVEFRPCIWDKHTEAKRLVMDLLTHDLSKRATVYAALESGWIESELKELQDLYQLRIEEAPGL